MKSHHVSMMIFDIIHCVSMVTEVINYHRNNGSSVYRCMLDASLDRVHLLTLYKTLYSREWSPLI